MLDQKIKTVYSFVHQAQAFQPHFHINNSSLARRKLWSHFSCEPNYNHLLPVNVLKRLALSHSLDWTTLRCLVQMYIPRLLETSPIPFFHQDLTTGGRTLLLHEVLLGLSQVSEFDQDFQDGEIDLHEDRRFHFILLPSQEDSQIDQCSISRH